MATGGSLSYSPNFHPLSAALLFLEDSMSNYSEQFKDPRWQQFRLKVLERDGFRCVFCGDEENTLHVHHLYYISKRKPWEYPLGCARTLCEDCHKQGHANKSGLDEWELLIAAFEGDPFIVGRFYHQIAKSSKLANETQGWFLTAIMFALQSEGGSKFRDDLDVLLSTTVDDKESK